jgi:hypothetical protein
MGSVVLGALLPGAYIVCFGDGANGLPGQLTTSQTGAMIATLTAVDMTSTAIPSSMEALVVDVNVGDDHACAVFAHGRVKCWGLSTAADYRLGGPVAALGVMGNLPYLDFWYSASDYTLAVQQVACGGLFSCSLHANGALLCWGAAGAGGALGRGRGPTDVVGSINFATLAGSWMLASAKFLTFSDTAPAVHVSAGAGFACAIFGGVPGKLRCWGANTAGQLARDTLSPLGLAASDLPALPYVAFGTTDLVLDVDAGTDHACALFASTSSGGVRCWGSNANGKAGLNSAQVAVGSGALTSSITSVPFIPWATTLPAVAVMAGDSVSCAQFAADPGSNPGAYPQARCWGAGALGQNGGALASANTGTVANPTSSVPLLSSFSASALAGVRIQPGSGVSLGTAAAALRLYGPPGLLEGAAAWSLVDRGSGFTVTGQLDAITAGMRALPLPLWNFTDPATTGVADLAIGPSAAALVTLYDRAFTFYRPPNITAVSSPGSPVQGGGSLLSVYGTDFGAHMNPCAMRFRQTGGTQYTTVGCTLITAAPARAIAVVPAALDPGGYPVDLGLRVNNDYVPFKPPVAPVDPGEYSYTASPMFSYSAYRIANVIPSVISMVPGASATSVIIDPGDLPLGYAAPSGVTVRMKFIDTSNAQRVTVIGAAFVPYPTGSTTNQGIATTLPSMATMDPPRTYPLVVSIEYSVDNFATPSSAFLVTLISRPVVLQVTPSIIPQEDSTGVPITVFGANFVSPGANTVTVRLFDTQAGTNSSVATKDFSAASGSFALWTATSLTSGTFRVYLTYDGIIESSDVVTLQVYGIVSVSPTSLDYLGGEVINIVGSNLVNTVLDAKCVSTSDTGAEATLSTMIYVSRGNALCLSNPGIPDSTPFVDISLLPGAKTSSNTRPKLYSITATQTDGAVNARPLVVASKGSTSPPDHAIIAFDLQNVKDILSDAVSRSGGQVRNLRDGSGGQGKIGQGQAPRTFGHHVLEVSLNSNRYFPVTGGYIAHYYISGIFPVAIPQNDVSQFVTLTGQGFLDTNTRLEACKYGTFDPTPALVVSYTRILCTVPAYASNVDAVGSLEVTMNVMGSPAIYTDNRFQLLMYVEPFVTAVKPASGPGGGAPIVITVYGLNLGATTGLTSRVRFGAADVACGQVAGTLVCPSLPAGVGKVIVSASLNNGTHYSNIIQPVYFFYLGVFSLTPRSVPRGVPTSTKILLSGAGFAAGAVGCQYGAMPNATVTVLSSSQALCNLPTPMPAAATTTALEYTADGIFNSGSGRLFDFYNPPSVTALEPTAGPAGGGIITLHGSGFGVLFKDLMCRAGLNSGPATFVSAAKVLCSPLDGVGPNFIEVSLNQGYDYTNSSKTYTFFTVSQSIPRSGVTAGGTAVLITGSNIAASFTGILVCRFTSLTLPALPLAVNGTASTYVNGTLLPDGRVRCVAPASISAVDSQVSLSLDGLTYTGGLRALFFYFRPPRVSSLDPYAGSSLGGSLVTVTGANFVSGVQGGLLCRFGILTTAPISVFSNSSLLCVSPRGSGAMNVEVSVNNGDYFSDDRVPFVYSEYRQLSPDSAPSAGGTPVMVLGSGFLNNGNMTCKFGALAVSARFLSTATALCYTPRAVVIATVPFTFSLDGINYATTTLPFTFFSDPNVTAVVPDAVPTEGGAAVTLYGRGFPVTPMSAISCKFGLAKTPAFNFTVGIEPINNDTVTTAVMCRAPPGPLGLVQATVSFNNEGTYSPGVSFVDQQVISVTPDMGPDAGGSVITVAGRGFASQLFNAAAALCRFDFLAGREPLYSPATLLDDDLVTCVTVAPTANATAAALAALPPPVNGTARAPARVVANVSISTNGITFSSGASANYTWVPSPVITSFVKYGPSTSRGEAPAWIAINGAGFFSTAEMRCEFGRGLLAPMVVFAALGIARCQVPSGSGAVNLEITFNSGGNYIPVGVFTFHEALSVEPAYAPTSGGTAVSVRGSGFANTGPTSLLCKVGGSVSPATYLTNSTVLCTLPAGLPGLATVYVSVNGLDYGAGVPVTYYRPIVVSGLSPSASHTSGGVTVTVSGANFIPGVAVFCKFGAAGAAAALPTTGLVLSPAEAACQVPVAADPGLSVVPVAVSHNGLDFSPSPVDLNYTVCAPGSFARVYTEPCVLCPAGSFSDTYGATSCILCDRTYFSDRPGSTSCQPCPPLSEIPYDERTSLSLCACKPGAYSRNPPPLPPRRDTNSTIPPIYADPTNATASKAAADAAALILSGNFTAQAIVCESCPRGGACDGARALPTATPGFWAAEDNPVLFAKCDVPEACSGGGPESCAPGYKGQFCASCVKGYYPLYRRCVSCPPTAPFRLPLFVIFTFIVACVLFLATGSNTMSTGGVLVMSVSLFQTLSFISKLNLGWNAPFLTLAQALTVPFTFELDALATECSYPTKYQTKWLLMFMFPALFMVHFAIIFAATWGYLTLRGSTTARLPGAIGLAGSGMPAVVGLPAGSRMLTGVDALNRAINAALILIRVIYLMPTILSFEIWDCTLRVDGKFHLDASPSQVCFESWHTPFAVIGAAGIVFYGAVLPVSIVVFIKRNRRRLCEPVFSARYGALYEEFKDSVPYWEAVVQGLKFSLLVPIVFFTVYEDFQLFSFLFVLVVALIINQLYRPYFLERFNRLQMFSLWMCIALLLVGMGIRSSYINKKYTSEMWGLFAAATIIMGGSVVLVLGFVLFELSIMLAQTIRRVDPELLESLDLLMHRRGKAELAQWFGRGGNGLRYAPMFSEVLASIARDARGLRADPTAIVDSMPIDKFIDLYSGMVFSPYAVGVVRDWLVRRIDSGTDDDFFDVFLFQKSFAQLCKFQQRLRGSTSFVLPQALAMDVEEVAEFRELLNPAGAEEEAKKIKAAAKKKGKKAVSSKDLVSTIIRPLEPVRNLLVSLYQGNVVSDTVIVAVMMQLYAGDETSLVSMNKAFLGLAVAKEEARAQVKLLAARASGGSAGGDTGDEEMASLRKNAADEEAAASGGFLSSFGSVMGNGTSPEVEAEMDHDFEDMLKLTADPATVRSNVGMLLPYLVGFYEGSYTKATLLRLALWVEDGIGELPSIRKVMRSPFYYLHSLYVSTREDTFDKDGQAFAEIDDDDDDDDGWGIGNWFGGLFGGGDLEADETPEQRKRRLKALPWYHGFKQAWKTTKSTVGFQVSESESDLETDTDDESDE